VNGSVNSKPEQRIATQRQHPARSVGTNNWTSAAT
jgi:hypothetical protein